MRLVYHVRCIAAPIVSLAMLACGPSDVPRHDTAIRAMIPLDTVESRGSLATRREAQPSFDAARGALAQRRIADAEAALTDAATFFRDEARVADRDARLTLERAAVEMDTLARSVARGDLHAPGLLDRPFARAHAAEASLHLTRAHAAIMRRDNVRAGEELFMSIDHIERAAKDARLQADTAVQAAVANTRSLAIEMINGMEAVPDEAARVTDEIERAIERLVTSTRARE